MLRELKKAYGRLTAPMKASLFFVLCNILQRGISLITAPIFTRLLTTQQYGIYSVYNSWYSIISIFATLNLSYGVFLTGLTRFEDDRPRFVSSMQGISTTVTAVVFCIYLLFRELFNQLFGLPTILMVFLFLELFFVPAFGFWSSVQRNEYRYRALVAVTLGMSVASAVFGVIGVLLVDTYKAEARILVGIAVQICVGLYLYILQWSRGKTFYCGKYWKYALTFNIPLLPHYLSMSILQQSDRIMIGSMIGKSEAAIYSVAYTVSTLMTLVTQAINNSFTPYTYQAIKKGNYDAIGKNANYLLALVGCGCVAIAAFGPEVIAIMAPESYHDAIWIIPPVAASVYFMFLYPLFGNIEFYYSKTKFTMLASCVGAGLNILLNWIFIPKFGYYAAGYTTLVCYICFAFAHAVAYFAIAKREFPGHRVYQFPAIIKISLFVLALMAMLVATYRIWYIRYGMILLILGALVICRKKLIAILQKIRSR